MLTKILTKADWLALSDLGIATFMFGTLLLLFGIALLEWWEIKPKIKPLIKFFKPKK
jgi:hypothetical protein